MIRLQGVILREIITCYNNLQKGKVCKINSMEKPTDPVQPLSSVSVWRASSYSHSAQFFQKRVQPDNTQDRIFANDPWRYGGRGSPKPTGAPAARFLRLFANLLVIPGIVAAWGSTITSGISPGRNGYILSGARPFPDGPPCLYGLLS